MNAIIGKSKICNDKFSKSLDINKQEITDKKIIPETFNKFFTNVGSNLADKIPPSSTNFESCLPNITTALSDKPLSKKEFKDAFFALKTNKSPGYDNLHANIIRSMYHELKIPLMNIFSQYLSIGIFTDKMKIAKVSPIFKNGKKSIASNYRPIPVLPCFSKFLERIMYNRFYSYQLKIIFCFINNSDFGQVIQLNTHC